MIRIAVIAVVPPNDRSEPSLKYLLGFSTLQDESNMSADAMIDLLDDLLDLYTLSASQLCFLVPDDNICTLITRLDTVKNRHMLRQAGALMPVLRNATRWNSTFAIVKRYINIREKLNRAALAVILPTPKEDTAINRLCDDLE
ncbi:TPA: hypothetical protein N0F65_001388 [Lagenidium giganteum]|uniref:Uncharacterized protein n=1 Tax=Lagenidium giganteum TaxID=4803 RepID=A0AAV2YZS8_9STRA|nr:TPA: hypothetical protein N0F65_001388 [Lagenidium giganteum]